MPTDGMVSIGDLCDRSVVRIQTGPFGSQLHAHEYRPTGTPVVPTEAIGRGRILSIALPRVDADVVARLSRHRLVRGDILFARRGAQATGLSAIVEERHEGAICGTGVILLRVADQQRVDPWYLSFALSAPDTVHWLKENAVGAVMPNLNADLIRRVQIRLPNLHEQRAIADILRALGDKIELNGRMNATLDALARALFKSWFIDFDPVHASSAGVVGFPIDGVSLFPRKLVSTDFGPVPAGWRIGELAQVATFTRGLSYKSEHLREASVALVNLKSIARGGGYRSDGLKPYAGEWLPEQEVRHGDIVVAHTDLTQAAEVLGRVARVIRNPTYTTLVASLDLAIVRPSGDAMTREYLYYALLRPEFADHAFGYANGTTVLHLGKKALPEYRLVLPPPDVVKAFTRAVEPLHALMDENEAENLRLAELRDALLRGLVSGEMTLRSASRAVEAVSG
jgi:type I restriction enzyme S subunit